MRNGLSSYNFSLCKLWKRKSLSLLIILGLLSPGLAAQENKTKANLQTVTEEILALEARLKKDKNQKNFLSKELKATELSMGSLVISLQQLEKKLSRFQTRLGALEQQQNTLHTHLNEQQAELATQLRTAYIFSETEQLKMLLNQENISAMGRTLVYLKYLNQNRLNLINELSSTLDKLAKNQQQIIDEQNQLQQLKKLQYKEHKELAEKKQFREQLLVAIKASIKTRSQQLANLKNNKKALESVFTQLQQQPRAPSSLPTRAFNLAPSSTFAFKQMKQKLPWPTQGAITQDFGKSIEHSDLTWNGVVISAPEGQNVFAVHPGTVAFAGWLKGFGLLIIVEHDNGYMSLYSRNSGLYKKVGEKVAARELIAKVGRSGGYAESGLYFEIRRDGRPMDPMTWLQQSNIA